ncbi:hypothetical protein F0562_028407 [Nyssa sinensis]|uniref:Ubiquitin-like domain-containing protein n=1 Tax=Nyssa sinensis TaxID=561372 RepID=A0A5J5AZV9_9ASTE|nr:hypothetical protein F0562_028407 [Nyssa sinensis]
MLVISTVQLGENYNRTAEDRPTLPRVFLFRRLGLGFCCVSIDLLFEMGAEGEPTESSISVAGGEEVTVNIRCSNGSKFSVRTSLASTVGAFKAVLSQNCEVPADQQRLIYKGRILKDDQTLDRYGLQADHTVHMVRGSAPAASTPTSGTATGGSPNTTPGVAQGVGSNEGGGFGGAGLGASLFPGLGFNALGGTGASGLFGTGLPEFEQVQQQLTQNPNMMREIINMPAIQNLMNNPDLMRNLIINNPQMREIIDRNPELAHILNDPGILRQTLEAARNPELMREMMRNTDRAMSNIESSPEGFNMLRRMYENVQEPFLNATTMAGGTGNDIGSNPFAALLGNQGGGGGAQTRDGGNNPSTTGSETTTGPAAPNTNPLPNPWSSTGGGSQTNTTTRSNPTGGARAPGTGGLGGLGLPELERMFGGMPDPSALNQLLQNPAVSQMMQSLLSNPQYMNQFLGLNPQLRAMLDSNPQLREMMQNPEILHQLTSPETMQQMLAVQQSLQSQLNRQQSTQESAQAGGTTGTQNNLGLDFMMNMFGGLGAGGLTVPNTPDVPPEQLYATQLSQLQEMGFFDTQENIRALLATSGNVHAAVERLLGNHSLFEFKAKTLLLTPPFFRSSTWRFQCCEILLQELVPVAAKKTALRDLQRENRIKVPKSMESSQFPKGSGPTIEAIKVSGTKRPASECMVSPPHQQSPTSNAANGHLVYVRRKPEPELGKSSTCDNTNNNADYPQSRKLSDQDETTQQKSQMSETKICIPEVTPIPRPSLMCFSSGKPSVPPSLGKSGNILPPADSTYLHVTSAIPSLDYPKRMNNQHWEERYHQIKNLLKHLDQSNQEDYTQMLQSFSSVELSRHAFELEKRSIQLSLEEAKEMQRVQFLDVLGKYPKNSGAPHQVQSEK